MNCPKCTSENFRALVEIGMWVDASDENLISKTVIRKGSTELVYKNHNATSYVCVDCSHHIPSSRGKEWMEIKDKEWLKKKIENLDTEVSENYPHYDVINREDMLNLVEQLGTTKGNDSIEVII